MIAAIDDFVGYHGKMGGSSSQKHPRKFHENLEADTYRFLDFISYYDPISISYKIVEWYLILRGFR